MNLSLEAKKPMMTYARSVQVPVAAQWILVVWLLLSASTSWSAACDAVFPDGAQVSQNGQNATLTFQWGSRLIGSPDNILDVRFLTDNAGH